MDSSRTTKPLRILTLDGGGLQATSTLLILDNVLKAIAKQNGVPEEKRPRPCDVFDVIAGIGTGGWLAIFLGRFRMDISACLSEWYNLMHCIEPSPAEELRLRLLHHCSFDIDCLVEQVKLLTNEYGTGDRLFESDIDSARTRHVFVAAPATDAKGYKLFRSYEIPKSAKLPAKLLEGPQDPSSFEISRAFGATFAARHFTRPWEERMASSGKLRLNDTQFPKPHSITQLALEEMWGIYGTDVPLSLVVNIGPGLPHDSDLKRIARKPRLGFKFGSAHEATSTETSKSSTSPVSGSDNVEQDMEQSSDRFHKDEAGDASTLESLRRFQSDLERKISTQLSLFHPGDADPYFRLAPVTAPRCSYLNDSSIPGAVQNATITYLSSASVEDTVDGIAKRMQEVGPTC